MVTEEQLFRLVKKCLPDNHDIKLRFGHSRTTDNISAGSTKLIKNTLGVFFKNAYKPVRLASGEYVSNSRRIIFNLYTDLVSDESIASGYDILSQIRHKMTNLRNCKFNIGTNSNPEYISIVTCEVAIDTNYIGLSEQGQAMFSLELIINY